MIIYILYLSHLVKACAAAEPPQPWVKGEAPASSKLGKATRWLLQRSWRTLVSTFKDDDDKDTVAAAAESISEIVLLLGPSVLANAPWHPASTDPLVNGAAACPALPRPALPCLLCLPLPPG